MLITDRLTLRRIVKEDYNEIVKLHTCPIVREHLGGALSYETACKRARLAAESPPELYWGIKGKDKQFKGTIQLDKHHDSDRIEVSYLLFSDTWGNGYAKESLEAIINYSKTELEYDEILAETQSKNLRSVKLLRRVGFIEFRKLERFGETQSLFKYRVRRKGA